MLPPLGAENVDSGIGDILADMERCEGILWDFV